MFATVIPLLMLVVLAGCDRSDPDASAGRAPPAQKSILQVEDVDFAFLSLSNATRDADRAFHYTDAAGDNFLLLAHQFATRNDDNGVLEQFALHAAH